MELALSTPSILFPAVSLLLLAYTNRFLAIAAIIRNLYARYQKEGGQTIRLQIENLTARLSLIRKTQSLGVLSLLTCTLSVILLFLEFLFLGKLLFVISLLCMLSSLIYCLFEIQLSGRALEIELQAMRDQADESEST